MANTQKDFIERLAQGNPVDLEKLQFVQQQLRQLEQVGVAVRPSYTIERPLGRPLQIGKRTTLANAGGLTRR
jgi:hypothetical protein